jgi:Insertion element 4 transposase N-terminal/Transposase DDE domain
MALRLTDRYADRPSFEKLVEGMPAEWIEGALSASGTATMRRRRIPAEQAVRLVLGMALYRGLSIVEIMEHLQLALPDERGRGVAPSAPIQARARLGDEALRWIFERSAHQWGHAAARRHAWRGLAVYGVDGTTVRVPDSPENRATFGGQTGRLETHSGYPQVRMVTLMALRTHLLAAARIGGYATGELTLAEDIWAEVPDASVCIVDRGFFTATTLTALASTGKSRHWLTRTRKRTQLRRIKRLGKNDELVEIVLGDSTRRNLDVELPQPWIARAVRYQRPGFPPQVLLTSMLDHRSYPAREIAALYHERWELELGFDEVKTEMLDREEALRSQSPRGVAQEIWALALVYNLVRAEMESIADDAGVPPTRVSFVTALHLMRSFWFLAARIAPARLPRQLAKLRGDISRFILPERRTTRLFPRAVKIKMSNYPRKRPLAEAA